MQRDVLLGGQAAEHAQRDVEVVAGVRQRPQRTVQGAEGVVPVGQDDAARGDARTVSAQ